MPPRRPTGIAWLLLSLALAAACSWWGDERAAIRQRLRDFTQRVNSSPSDGAGSLARAEEIGAYLTDDVVVDLGHGTAPLAGRDTLVGMILRLQPRLSDFTLGLADVNIQLARGEETAAVSLTAEFIRRDPTVRQSMDAREFKVTMRLDEDEWRIARVTAVETLR